MCTRCSVPTHRLLDLLGCLLRLVDQVRNALGQFWAHLYWRLLTQEQLPLALLLLLLLLRVFVSFCGPVIFSYLFPIRCCYVNDNPCIPDAFGRIHCYYHLMSLRKLCALIYLKFIKGWCIITLNFILVGFTGSSTRHRSNNLSVLVDLLCGLIMDNSSSCDRVTTYWSSGQRTGKKCA